MWRSLDSVGLLILCVLPSLRVCLIFLILIASQPYQPPSRKQSTQRVSLSAGSISACLWRPSPSLELLETTCTSTFPHVTSVSRRRVSSLTRRHWHAGFADLLDVPSTLNSSHARFSRVAAESPSGHRQDTAKTSRHDFFCIFVFFFAWCSVTLLTCWDLYKSRSSLKHLTSTSWLRNSITSPTWIGLGLHWE